ncbi:hypothetical protein ABW21_db0200131 [Orbilia brochopaga]|nr:hypothetical protein ABW21_db0200131 [Drechslerella brochopaga]
MRLLGILFLGSTCVPGVFAQAADESYTSDQVFKDTVLNVTNTYRDWYNASALTWNDTLAEAGQRAVEDCIFQHSGQEYGENLAAGYPNVTAAITGWKDEVDDYNYGDPDFSMQSMLHMEMSLASSGITLTNKSADQALERGDSRSG